MSKWNYLGPIIGALVATGAVANPAASQPALSISDSSNQIVGELTKEQLSTKFKNKTITTQTPWSNGDLLTYRGPKVIDVLKDVGLENAAAIEGYAANGFSAKLNMADVKNYSPILATEIECTADLIAKDKCTQGEFVALSVKEYGPIFVVWPFDQLPDAVDPRDHSKWIWFVTGIRSVE